MITEFSFMGIKSNKDVYSQTQGWRNILLQVHDNENKFVRDRSIID